MKTKDWQSVPAHFFKRINLFAKNCIFRSTRNKKLHKSRQKQINTHEFMQGIIDGSSDLIVAIDSNHRFITFNAMYKAEIYRIFKVHLKEGMYFDVLLSRMSTENKKKNLTCWSRALSGESFTVLESFKDSKLAELDYEIRYTPIFNQQGIIIGASHIASNIHQRIQSESNLAESKKNLELMVMYLEQQNKELKLLKELTSLLQVSLSVDDAIETIASYIKRIMKDTSGAMYLNRNNSRLIKHVLSWGEPCSNALNWKTQDCLALIRHQPHVVKNTSEDLLCKHIKVSLQKPLGYMCLPLLAQNSPIGLLYIELKPNHKRVIALAHVISEQIALSLYNIQLREDLKTQSVQDSLTKLYNRRFFEEYVHKEIIKAKRHPTTFAILLLDIDSFKKINDTYGHLMGDRVLHEVALQLQKNCRESDLVARWGGEEFVIYLRDISHQDAIEKAEILRKSIEKPNTNVHFATLQSPITLSIGIALFSDHGDSIDKLISKADKALYQAKHEGKNRTIVAH